ncbi:heavy-metal-associated domain-containing protein [Dactylosporangium sp. CS-047395]|uniref:heavy-metal-associated domain-containing protein n=1 Tax=Dactylosporangium sp. CS-047395 TaxID=3239936 RepID=UPI003D93C78C
METIYSVTGMTCQHCVNAVTEELRGLDGVSGVRVDLPTGSVTVTSVRPLDPAAVRAAVDEAGYAVAA